MGAYSQVELPSNFYTMTSSMLLQQPEPQYLYADLFMRAIGASLQVPADLGVNLPANGAAYSAAEKDRLILSDPLSTQLFSVNVNFNGTPGSTVRINRPVYTDTVYTSASRIVPSGSTISTTPVTVSGQQTNLTLYRYAGPYDTANSRVAPYGIDSFDASMGVHNAASIHGTHLKRDFHKFLDSQWVTLFDLAATAVYPEGVSAANDMTVLGDFPFSLEQLTRTERLMDEAHLPTLPDGFRLYVATPRQLADLKLDDNYMRLAESYPQFNGLFGASYVKSVGKFHIFKSTTLSQTANGSGVAVQYGHAIAPGVAMGGMGKAPRVAPNTQDNYGEMPLVIWIAYLAMALANNTFVYSVRSA
jgi:hypothetical protein